MEQKVKGIQSGSSESDTRLEHKVLQESLDPGQTAFALAQLESLEICLKEAEEKAKVLSKQLAVSEGTKLKLLERVSWLEKKLEALDHKETSEEPYEIIVHLKDQCIEKLQAEVTASRERLAAHKLEHKKKVEKLQTDLAIAKQEAAITALELSEEIRMLCEGKPSPRGQCHHVTCTRPASGLWFDWRQRPEVPVRLASKTGSPSMRGPRGGQLCVCGQRKRANRSFPAGLDFTVR
ncbi:coiled-coil domain-containing protein 192-like [Lepus europaeus]|uniref:coiled-coil domain-containing protein 192-like n=1 Tax=Lepus europaeus TaxID=9983 RepID=UPI002B45A33A|nr:coiled-coil domain-containing protein 192-like [Lepus europaeus]